MLAGDGEVNFSGDCFLDWHTSQKRKHLQIILVLPSDVCGCGEVSFSETAF